MRIASKLAIVSLLVLASGCNDMQRQATYSSEPAHAGEIISSGPYSSTTTQVVNPADRALENSLRDDLSRYGDLASVAPNVQITARNGTVTLSGTAPSERDRQMIEAMVRNAAGVTSVNDQLQVSYSPTGAYNQPSRVYSAPAPQVVTAPLAAPGEVLNLRVQGVTDGDRILGQRIVDELRADTVLPTLVPTVNVSVAEGRVSLRGLVQNEQQRRAIISAVQRVPGVTAVYDEMRFR
jgi:osmotically-inducible protein OsmY